MNGMKNPQRSYPFYLTTALGCASSVLGIAVILGWYTQSTLLTQIHPSFAPMQYNTALGFLLCGIGLLAIQLEKQYVCQAAGFTVAILGVFTLFQYIFGFNLGIDELFMDGYIDVKTSHPGRMAPNTALCFTLFGLSLVLYGSKNVVISIAVEVITFAVLTLSTMALVGFLFSNEMKYGWGNFTSMAVHTSVGFTMVSVGLLIQCWVHLQTKQHTLSRKIIPLICACIVFVTALIVYNMVELDYGRRISRHINLAGMQRWLSEHYMVQVLLTHQGDEQDFQDTQQRLEKNLDVLINGGTITLSPEEENSGLDQLILPPAPHKIFEQLFLEQKELLDAMVETGNALLTSERNSPEFRQHSTKFLQDFRALQNKANEAVLEYELYYYQFQTHLMIVEVIVLVIFLIFVAWMTRHFWTMTKSLEKESEKEKTLLSQLKEKDKELNLTFQATKVGMWEWQISEDSIFWDDTMLRMFNVPKDVEFTYAKFEACLHPEDKDRVNEAVKQSVEQDSSYDIEYRIVWDDQSIHHIVARGFVTRNENREPVKFTGICFDITQQREVEEALNQNEEKYRNLYQSVPVSIWEEDWSQVIEMLIPLWEQGITDFLGYYETHPDFVKQALKAVKIIDVNNESIHMFQAETKEQLLQSMETVFATEDALPGFIGELVALGNKKRYYKTEMRLNTVLGETISTILTMTFPENPTESGQVLVSLMDITNRVNAEKELAYINKNLEKIVEERTVELQASNKELEAFSYSVSHDLRAPLRHLSGFLELLIGHAQDSLDDKSKRYLSIIQESSSHLGKLIDDLLEFSRTGRSEIVKQQVPVNELVNQTVDELTPELKDRNVEWKIDPLPNVYGDQAMLKLVIMNLIGNAVKYSKNNEQAKIQISSLNNREDEDVIFVKDNGVGFDMKYVDKMFNVFQRLHSKNEFEGTGIGLANVQRIVHRHGGQCWAEGEVNKGATLYFSIPKKA